MPTLLKLCADFAPFPDNTVLGPSFSLAGYKFTQPAGSTPLMFVNITGSERGLQFPHQGVRIKLPAPVKKVSLRLGAFASPVDIIARSKTGAVVYTSTLNTLNTYVNINISAPNIATLVLRKGNNEGILVKICVTLRIC